MFDKAELEKYALFDPTVDKESKIVDCPGLYVLLLRKGSKLPECGVDYTPCMITYDGEEYELIYVGISNKSLRKRDFHQHFTKNNAGQSTLRKSIGSLMGLKKTYRSEGEKGKPSPKIKFVDNDEEKLSEWMKKNLLLLFKASSNPKDMEKDMIAVLNPPLNISENTNFINRPYRDNLSRLRNDRSDLD
ncbi:MAG: hypothetical protein K2J82_02505 [Muribaculaceae bacterium]|nr:hypothetical protein [Muribaculaceae bacterium]MDE6753462.1 hypothetical protein [Muribaculaceae bacterium]